MAPGSYAPSCEQAARASVGGLTGLRPCGRLEESKAGAVDVPADNRPVTEDVKPSVSAQPEPPDPWVRGERN